MATLPEIVNYLEADDALHLGRLLVLIDTFGGRAGDKQIEGLTKRFLGSSPVEVHPDLENCRRAVGIRAGRIEL